MNINFTINLMVFNLLDISSLFLYIYLVKLKIFDSLGSENDIIGNKLASTNLFNLLGSTLMYVQLLQNPTNR